MSRTYRLNAFELKARIDATGKARRSSTRNISIADRASRSHHRDVITFAHSQPHFRTATHMQKSRLHIQVSVRDQELKLRRGRKIVRRYPVSTSRFGLGSAKTAIKRRSENLRISDKIGRAMPPGTIFVGRVALRPDDPLPPTEDLVLSRILWLDGVEPQTLIPAIVLFTFTEQGTRTKSANPTATGVSGCETQMSSSFMTWWTWTRR
jgi:hypothetical protein